MSQRTNLTGEQYQELIRRNPKLLGNQASGVIPKAVEKVTTVKIEQKLRCLHKQRIPNKTEAEFGRWLKALLPSSEIKYEALKLSYGEGQIYTPDWWVNLGPIVRLYEVKGPHKRDIDVARYKACKAEWKHIYEFEFWQRDKNKVWHQLD